MLVPDEVVAVVTVFGAAVVLCDTAEVGWVGDDRVQ